MKIPAPRTLKIALAMLTGLGAMFVSESGMVSRQSSLISQAEAVIGRPLTPMSYAGVARRTTRRAVGAGAAAGAAAAGAYYARPGCVQATNAYGQVYWRCP